MNQVAHDFFGQFRRYWNMTQRWLPQGWLDALRQLLLFAGAYYAYRLVRGLVDGQAALAFENARSLVDVERGMGLFFEPGLQNWAQTNTQWLVDGANFMYVNSHFVITTTFLIWLYIFRNPSFYYVRNMFMIAMFLALVGYVVYPTAPPRFMPEWGFTDTVSAFVGQSAEQSANVLYNPFAAVPSMHVAFALMIGLPAASIVRTGGVQGAVAGLPGAWSPSWSWSPPTTSGWTPRWGPRWPPSPPPPPRSRWPGPAPTPGRGARAGRPKRSPDTDDRPGGSGTGARARAASWRATG